MIWNYMMFTDYCWEDPFRLKDGYISRKRGVVKFIPLQFTFLGCGPTFYVSYKTFPFSVMLPGKLLLFSSKSATTNDTMTCFRASSQRPDDATQRKLQMSQLSLPGSHLQTGRYTFRSKGWPSVPNTQPRPHLSSWSLLFLPAIPIPWTGPPGTSVVVPRCCAEVKLIFPCCLLPHYWRSTTNFHGLSVARVFWWDRCAISIPQCKWMMDQWKRSAIYIDRWQSR